ncbi:MarR family transcriptional regulator [Scatolibacter rhodanostii]|uniref:MarR family transcriptional regulator n=1 Tax=Scatolibacter rhodanostii TaxID=2014781 RepID=UPI000C08BF59|nr:helix-turn-helix domain-containing protein [Scatolibacter rhodanostii]
MKVRVTKATLDTRAFIRWTRRNLKGSEGDIILLLMEFPEGLTAEQLTDDLNIKRRTLTYILQRLKKRGYIKDYRKYSNRTDLKLGNSKIKVFQLSKALEHFLK